jgi:hypothetical protein
LPPRRTCLDDTAATASGQSRSRTTHSQLVCGAATRPGPPNRHDAEQQLLAERRTRGDNRETSRELGGRRPSAIPRLSLGGRRYP